MRTTNRTLRFHEPARMKNCWQSPRDATTTTPVGAHLRVPVPVWGLLVEGTAMKAKACALRSADAPWKKRRKRPSGSVRESLPRQ